MFQMPNSARNVLQFLYTGVVCDPQIFHFLETVRHLELN